MLSQKILSQYENLPGGYVIKDGKRVVPTDLEIDSFPTKPPMACRVVYDKPDKSVVEKMLEYNKKVETQQSVKDLAEWKIKNDYNQNDRSYEEYLRQKQQLKEMWRMTKHMHSKTQKRRVSGYRF